MIDGNGNRAELRYDGFGRQTCWLFPSPARPPSYSDATPATALATAGSVNGDCASNGDFEAYGYDLNGNRINLRKRDGRNIAFAYDALNRMTAKTYPQGGATAVHYSYDLRNLQLSARFASSSGEGIANVYDGFGRLSSTSTNMGGVTRTLGYGYDANGNRLSLIHPDGIWFGAMYDGLNRHCHLRTRPVRRALVYQSLEWLTQGVDLRKRDGRRLRERDTRHIAFACDALNRVRP